VELEVDQLKERILKIQKLQLRPDLHQEEAEECLIEEVDLPPKQCLEEYLKEGAHLVEVEQVEDVVVLELKLQINVQQ